MRDLAATERFYEGVLGVRDPRLRLVEARGDGGGWIADDRQPGDRRAGPLRRAHAPAPRLLRVDAEGQLRVGLRLQQALRLFYVDYDTLERAPKQSARSFAEVTRRNGLPV